MKILLWVLMGLAGLVLFLLALLAVLLLLPARVRVMLQEETFFLWAGLGPFRLRLLPWKERQPKEEKKPAKCKKQKRQQEPAPLPSQMEADQAAPGDAPQVCRERAKKKRSSFGGGKKLDISYIIELLKLGLSAAGQFRRALRVDHFFLDCTIASGDAAQTAMAYGAVATGVGLLLPLLEERLRVRKKDIQVVCDFEGTASRVFLDVQMSALVFQLLMIGIKVLREYLRLGKQHDQEAVSV